MIGTTSSKLACPVCHGFFTKYGEKIQCKSCNFSIEPNQYGFFDFTLDKSSKEINSTTNLHAEKQSSAGANRLDDEFIIPYLQKEPFESVLDVGCGIGRTVAKLLDMGHDAYGVDLPCLSKHWSQAGMDAIHMFCADATSLPFPDNSFDAVVSLGVIEHVGTATGHCTLMTNYMEVRRKYAQELLRVTRSGGRILVACPNKSFPIDPQHEVRDDLCIENLSIRFRDAIFRKTGLNIHQIWGRYYLPSYAEVRSLFCGNGEARSFEPLSLKGYFALDIFKQGLRKPFLKPAEIYINKMPRFLRASFLNPYVLVQIRK